MRKQVLVRVAAGLLLLLLLPGAVAQAGGWAESRQRTLAQWLLQCQRADGALRNRPDAPDVTPYFANQAGLALLGLPGGPARVRAYLDWYLDRLNRRDRYGLSGTVYDEHPGQLTPPDYDSADAYAATFLSLARAYVQRTGDWGWARSREAQLDAVGHLLATLQDGDGLVRAGGPTRTRYLMDNSEDYAGLLDWAWVLDGLGRPRSAAAVRRRADLLALAINQILWDPVSSSYRWASPPWQPDSPDSRDAVTDATTVAGAVIDTITGGDGSGADWSRWYPDAVAQLFPALYGVPQPRGRAVALHGRLERAFPGWPQGETGDHFPWVAAGLAAWRLGEYGDARRLLDHLEARYPAEDAWRAPEWHSAEAGFELRLRAAMAAPMIQTPLWRFVDGSY